SEPPVDTSTSAALTQLGQTWPVAGRQVGIVVGPDFDPGTVETLRAALGAAGVVPLVVGPHGGVISGVTMQRSYAVVASVELDAVVLTGALPPAPDARASVDAKAGVATAGTVVDPRVVKLLDEVWRHAKAIGAVDDADDVLTAAGVPIEGTGVVVGKAGAVAAGLLEFLAAHRTWERFTPVSAG
ncbi:MAG: catalase HPII, partial [Janthinobacterium lividum]